RPSGGVGGQRPQRREVGQADALAPRGEPALGAEAPERPAGGLPGRAYPGRQVVLADDDRDLDSRPPMLAQPLGEVDEPAGDAAGDVPGVAIDAAAVGGADLRRAGAGGTGPASGMGPARLAASRAP